MDLTSILQLLQYPQCELVLGNLSGSQVIKWTAVVVGGIRTPVFPSEAIGLLNQHKQYWLGCLDHHFLNLVIAS